MDRTALFRQLGDAHGPRSADSTRKEQARQGRAQPAPGAKALFLAAHEARDALAAAQPLLARAKIPIAAAAWAPEEVRADTMKKERKKEKEERKKEREK